MFNRNKNLAFTFIELIIVVTILAILSTIGFYSYVSSLGDSRDSKRKSDLALVESALISYKQTRGAYPNPGDSFNIINNTSTTVAKQGKLNKKVSLSTLDALPLDPEGESEYFYSVTTNKQNFQLAGTLENGDSPKSLLVGDYSSVAKNVLPTLILALSSSAGSDIEINSGATATNGDTNRTTFIFNDSIYNLPYLFDGDADPYNEGASFEELIADAESKDFWQNSDYTTCNEILEAGRSIGDGEYQIIDSITGELTSTGCTGM